MQIEYDLLTGAIKCNEDECPISMEDSIGEYVYRINGVDADVIFLETAPKWWAINPGLCEANPGWCEILSIMPKLARTEDIIRSIMELGELEGGH